MRLQSDEGSKRHTHGYLPTAALQWEMRPYRDGMAIPCPCCKASNESGPACRRCKADLGLLFAVDAARTERMHDARRMLGEARYDDALQSLEEAVKLRRGGDLSRLKAVAFLLKRDFRAALNALDEARDRP